MALRICICCGDPMSAKGNALSRNPNVCASCSSLADGMEEPNLNCPADPVLNQARTPETSENAAVQVGVPQGGISRR